MSFKSSRIFHSQLNMLQLDSELHRVLSLQHKRRLVAQTNELSTEPTVRSRHKQQRRLEMGSEW